jgi:hypothetical protein
MTVPINSMTESSSAISAVLAEAPDSPHERICSQGQRKAVADRLMSSTQFRYAR